MFTIDTGSGFGLLDGARKILAALSRDGAPMNIRFVCDATD